MSAHLDLGLFPLGLVLLPGERVPLHVFETRYRQLVADCVLSDSEFVVVQAVDQGVARVGCTARFVALGRRFADGRMNLTALGGRPVEILEETEGHLYFSARVLPVDDDPVPADPARTARVRDLFRRIAEQVTGSPQAPPVPTDVPLSYAVAGAIEIEADVKQGLLETRDENARLDMLADVLVSAEEGLDRARVAAERARGNGKVHLP